VYLGKLNTYSSRSTPFTLTLNLYHTHFTLDTPTSTSSSSTVEQEAKECYQENQVLDWMKSKDNDHLEERLHLGTGPVCQLLLSKARSFSYVDHFLSTCHTPCLESAADRLETIETNHSRANWRVFCFMLHTRREHCVNSVMRQWSAHYKSLLLPTVYWLIYRLQIYTSSSAVAKRLRDASCLSVVSFNGTKCRAESFIVSYIT